MENIINKYYVPYDNSYCVEYTTNKNSYLVPWLGSNEFNPTKEEIKAVFTIVTCPYTTMLENTCGEMKERTFINVKSSITDKVYRVLVNKDGICDTIGEYYRKVFERDSEQMQWFTLSDNII